MRFLFICLFLAGCGPGVVMTEDGRAIMTGLGKSNHTVIERVRPSPLPAPIEPGKTDKE